MCVLRYKGWGQGLEKGGREICSDNKDRDREREEREEQERERKRRREREREMSNTFCSLP